MPDDGDDIESNSYMYAALMAMSALFGYFIMLVAEGHVVFSCNRWWPKISVVEIPVLETVEDVRQRVRTKLMVEGQREGIKEALEEQQKERRADPFIGELADASKWCLQSIDSTEASVLGTTRDGEVAGVPPWDMPGQWTVKMRGGDEESPRILYSESSSTAHSSEERTMDSDEFSYPGITQDCADHYSGVQHVKRSHTCANLPEVLRSNSSVSIDCDVIEKHSSFRQTTSSLQDCGGSFSRQVVEHAPAIDMNNSFRQFSIKISPPALCPVAESRTSSGKKSLEAMPTRSGSKSRMYV